MLKNQIEVQGNSTELKSSNHALLNYGQKEQNY